MRGTVQYFVRRHDVQKPDARHSWHCEAVREARATAET